MMRVKIFQFQFQYRTTELLHVWYSDVSVIQMFIIQIPTVQLTDVGTGTLEHYLINSEIKKTV